MGRTPSSSRLRSRLGLPLVACQSRRHTESEWRTLPLCESRAIANFLFLTCLQCRPSSVSPREPPSLE